MWLGVALVLPGLWLLSITDEYRYRGGDPFVLACAFAWAAHILLIGHWAPKVDALRFTFLQFALTGAVGTVLGLALERPAPEAIANASGALLFAAVFPTVIAFGLQTVAQRVAPPAHSAILLSFEAVFALVAGILLLGETATGRQALGATLMFVGMLAAQVRVAPSR